MKFLADMGISMRTVVWLRTLGHDAVHLREQRLQRAVDAEIVAKAALEGRIVLTMDLDFGYLLAISGQHVPSVILLRLSDERSEVVNDRLGDVLAQCHEALEAGAIISVGKEQGRIGAIGVSSHYAQMARRMVASGLVDVLMYPVNLFGHSDDESLALYRECKASECIACGECMERCPFDVDVIARMQKAAGYFV